MKLCGKTNIDPKVTERRSVVDPSEYTDAMVQSEREEDGDFEVTFVAEVDVEVRE